MMNKYEIDFAWKKNNRPFAQTICLEGNSFAEVENKFFKSGISTEYNNPIIKSIKLVE